MEEKQAYRNRFWAFVTVFGTLWGGLELTLGTFLHVLHVPKTGFIMVALSAILLVAQRNIFPARWSTLAAGVIAACIKSLSPGGIIAGPIIGILGEALIIELCLLAAPRNLVLNMFAGSVALLWSQLQSVFKLWLYYGTDFLASVIKVIEKFLKIQWTAAVGWTVVGILLLIILGTGAVSGIIGHRLGRRVLKDMENAQITAESEETANASDDETAALPDESGQSAKDVMAAVGGGKRRRNAADNAQIVKTRLWVLPFAIATVVMQFGDNLWFAVGAAVLWCAVLAVGARQVLKAIWWPKFWIFTFVVSCLCGVVLAWQFEGSWDWALGCEAAVRMFLRGLYVFSLVSWATRCVRGEEFLSVWEKVHLPELGLSLTHAYRLLPRWLDRMNALLSQRPKGFVNNCRFIRQSCLVCLRDAVRDSENLSRNRQDLSLPRSA